MCDASVSVEGQVVSSIGTGLLVLIGVAKGDSGIDVEWMAEKIARLRIFEDSAGKMNESVLENGGYVLAVSQFTLLADTSRGRRPGFEAVAKPEEAEALYTHFAAQLKAQGCLVQCGVFGAHMQVRLTNDGPVTIMLHSPHSQRWVTHE